MEILFWLAPPALATLVAAIWVARTGGSGHAVVDPGEQQRILARMGEAIDRAGPSAGAGRRLAEPDSGVVVRPHHGGPDQG